MKGQARSPTARGRPYDRHSGAGVRGLPKKNGAGAKGVWGAAMDQEAVMVLDRNDPNYDSEEELPASISISEPVPEKSQVLESAASSPADTNGKRNAAATAPIKADK